MAHIDPTGHGASGRVSIARQDQITERAILTQVLAFHPARFTILELALQRDAGEEEFAAKDGVERAVRELIRDGLLHCDCRRIWPTRAALRFEALLGGGHSSAP